jgi:tRNA U34 2-thiouridine synthase MnmA/TrmU
MCSIMQTQEQLDALPLPAGRLLTKPQVPRWAEENVLSNARQARQPGHLDCPRSGDYARMITPLYRRGTDAVNFVDSRGATWDRSGGIERYTIGHRVS